MTRGAFIAVMAIGCHFESQGVGGSDRLFDAAVQESAIVVDSAPDVRDTAVVDTFDAGDRYIVLGEADDWYTARDRCKELGAHLVTITTAGELELVKQRIRAETWLGLRKTGDAGVFEWIMGEPFTLDGWKMGEPSGTGSCGKIAVEGKWLDHSCLEPLDVVCERD